MVIIEPGIIKVDIDDYAIKIDATYDPELNAKFIELNDPTTPKQELGPLGEQTAELYLKHVGFENRIRTGPEVNYSGNKGIDAIAWEGDDDIFNNIPTEINIFEVKQVDAGGGINLSRDNIATDLPPQMSDDWIESRFQKMIDNGTPEVKELGMRLEYLWENHRNVFQKHVIGMDKAMNQIVHIKIKEKQ